MYSKELVKSFFGQFFFKFDILIYINNMFITFKSLKISESNSFFISIINFTISFF